MKLSKTDNGYTFVIGSASMMFPFPNCNRLQKRHNRVYHCLTYKNSTPASSCGCGVSVNFDMDKLSMPA